MCTGAWGLGSWGGATSNEAPGYPAAGIREGTNFKVVTDFRPVPPSRFLDVNRRLMWGHLMTLAYLDWLDLFLYALIGRAPHSASSNRLIDMREATVRVWVLRL